ncbi:MAG: F0F1 ATP synthase subunit A [Phycisphaerae bacterium]|nr:F0F1 ATP synthase subunit A [Phycisphaerae bacterium]
MSSDGYNLIDHITDHPWAGCQWVDALSLPAPFNTITWMSSGIASMILVAGLLMLVLPRLARRKGDVPTGGKNVLEILVVFIRDMVARPALKDKADHFLPFLLTQFVFFLGMNLLGMIPLMAVTSAVGYNNNLYPVGFTATSILTVTGAQAALVLVIIVVYSLSAQAKNYRAHHGGGAVAAWLLSPILFIKSLVPTMPGLVGVLLWPMLMVIEVMSLISKCFALMIRIFANMLAGHSLLAAFMMFIMAAGLGWETLLRSLAIDALSITASVAFSLLELMVATLQAYIFTFLTAIFIGLYTEPSH